MQVEGDGHRIAAQKLRELLSQSISLLKHLLRYGHAFAIQANYTALANARGNIGQRLARWLLMARDRVDSDNKDDPHA